MPSPVVTTIIKMVESLPDELQEQVAEHVRAYIAELQEEKRWNTLFTRSQDNLIAAAHKAKAEIATGLSIPMNYQQS
jgi:hypothetical protein